MRSSRLPFTAAMVVLLAAVACGPAAAPTPTAGPARPAPSPTAAPAQPVPTPPAARKELQEVRIGMAYIPNVQFAPFYVADSKGFFAEEGIKPVYDYGFEQDVIALTAQDKLMFTNAGATNVIIARSRGVPVQYFIKEYQSIPVAIFALKEKGINRVTDLKGKTLGSPGPFGDTYVGLKIILHKNGLRESDLNILSIGFTQVESILANKVDAAVGYAINEPYQLRAQGKEVVVFEFKDFAPEVAGNGIIASEKTLREQPELARAFARAFLKGLQYTIENPREAFELSLKFVPEAAKDEQIKRAQMQTLELVVNNYWKTSGKLGASDVRLWEQTQTLMKEAGLIDKETDMSQAVTNAFLP